MLNSSILSYRIVSYRIVSVISTNNMSFVIFSLILVQFSVSKICCLSVVSVSHLPRVQWRTSNLILHVPSHRRRCDGQTGGLIFCHNSPHSSPRMIKIWLWDQNARKLVAWIIISQLHQQTAHTQTHIDDWCVVMRYHYQHGIIAVTRSFVDLYWALNSAWRRKWARGIEACPAPCDDVVVVVRGGMLKHVNS